MGIGSQQSRSRAPLRHVSLLVGSGGDLSLMSAIFQVPSGIEIANTRLSDWIRVETIEQAEQVAKVAHLKLVVADPAICARHDSLIDARGKSVPINPVSTAIERILGRAFVQHANSSHDATAVQLSQSRTYIVTKRSVDIGVGALALTLLAIPVAVIYGLFCLCLGRSTFVRRQEMVGKHGTPFILRYLEFIPVKSSRQSGRFKVANSINHALGRIHLRLWPALLSVLTGDMSLVGPRAESAEAYVRGNKISGAYSQRLLVRPGLISLARVRFPYSESPRDLRLALEYDLYYVKHGTPALDSRILGRASILLAGDALKTVVLSIRITGSMLVHRLSTLLGNDSLSASRIASVAMPTDRAGVPLDLKPTLVVGAGEGGKTIVKELQNDTGSGLWPVAFVDDDYSLLGARVLDVPVLGNSAAIQAVVDREHIETIILAIPSASEIDLQRIADGARETGVPTLTMPSIGGILRGDDATRLRVVPTSDLLGRTVVETNVNRCREFLIGKSVLVTGAAGSIGREVVLQALRGEPATIYGLDINESDLYDLQQELKGKESTTSFVPIVASVTHAARLNKIMRELRPNVVFHAAAYKHVPLMEDFPHEAVQSNIQGAWLMAQAAASVGVERFVLVSTDKAVRPSSVMGASKRIAELVVKDVASATGLSACAVRFGNVLGSRGSVIPLFERQIAAGGPITITDKRMTRYFMTIPEAAGLIIEAGAFGDSGVIYMLEMGEPVSIVDVADRLIRLHGKRPGTDIEIRYTGLRPGEKLFEELSLDFETARETQHPKIRILDEGAAERPPAELMMHRLLKTIQEGTPAEIRSLIMKNVEEADGIDVSLLGRETSPRKAITA